VLLFFCTHREVLYGERYPFDWNVNGRTITLLYCLAPVYLLLLLMLEYAGDGGSGGLLGRALRSIRGSYDRLRLSCNGVKSVHGQITLQDDNVENASPDEDVLNEEEFVKSTPDLKATAPVLMKNLWKVFPTSAGCCRKRKPRLAVRGLSAAIHTGETFGLLVGSGRKDCCTLPETDCDLLFSCGFNSTLGKQRSG
jgi:hypothetical protein